MTELMEEYNVGFSVMIDPHGSSVHIETKRQSSTLDICGSLVKQVVYVANDDGNDRIDILTNSINELLVTFTRLNLRANYSAYAKRAVVAEKLVSKGRDLSAY